ncbi:hypothetical protein MMB17_19350 [Methylobacterium organophilum]|uniref:hypothetical protein n=1 Tax=Methylobacterium organophilum TaxID=410 RepID=UPI001F133964|nr:hypothetical protein [Methylobacterium organophilum]UMY16800.1 hypothetical protein MMB17_19350 [Methylobacterium organophilum]
MLAVPSSALGLDAKGERLAQARLTGGLVDVDLAGLVDLDQAEDVRDTALRASAGRRSATPSSARIQRSRGRYALTVRSWPR